MFSEDSFIRQSAEVSAQPSPAVPVEVTTTLSVPAVVAFEVFSDVLETPRWLPVVHSAQVLEWTKAMRPARVSFVGRLDRASIGYTLEYDYDPSALSVRFHSAAHSTVRISGEAQFAPLSRSASLMMYRLAVAMPLAQAWFDPSYHRNAAASVVTEFREYLRRFG
jgi:Polyketide cyclase / dehydrase and lipid transport